MIGSLKLRKGCRPHVAILSAGPSKASAWSAAWRIGWDAPCVAGPPRLRLNWGFPVRPARRVLPLDVRHRALLVLIGSRTFHLPVVCEPCRQRFAGSIVRVRSLGVRALEQRFATIFVVVCGCTYASACRARGTYPPVIRQSRCICREASFLIRRSNNSGVHVRSRRPQDVECGASHCL